MSRRRAPSALLVASLLTVGIQSAGCSSGDSFGDADEWLEVACGDGADTTDDFEADTDLEDFAGGPQERLACETSDGDLAQAYQFDDDPSRELLNSGDGWESGDGSLVEWAVREIDEDEWVAIYVHLEGVSSIDGDALLEPLEDEGFEVSSND